MNSEYMDFKFSPNTMKPTSKKHNFRLIVCLIALFSYSCSPARQQIESFFNYLHDVQIQLHNDKSSEKKKEKLLNKARKRILKIIDTEYVAKISLGKYFDLISDTERTQFTNIFRQILANNIVKTHIPVNKISDQNINVELISEENKHDAIFNMDAIAIHTKFISNSVTYFIDFYLHPSGKTYKLYDVYVDGASVLLDYRNQFYSIIEKKGFPFLLQRLNEKFKEIEPD
ncbi:MAG: ABC transporter substrate-binding protein [Spirochaetia bacterium]|nr:ABC transporter substrate-binding protein [Spirochaetia bacterium]